VHVHILQYLLQVLDVGVDLVFLLSDIFHSGLSLLQSPVQEVGGFVILFEQWAVGFILLELTLLVPTDVVEIVLNLLLLFFFLANHRCRMVVALQHLRDVLADGSE